MWDFFKGIFDGKSGALNEWRNSTFGNGSFEFRDLLATPQHVFGNMKSDFSQVGSSSATGPTSDMPSTGADGLSIFGTFGDTIRQLQADAAARQEAYQTNSAAKAMKFSADEAQKNRDWQEYMSSTSYSRAVEDLKNAGLNPVLAAGGGAFGASTPSGSSAAGIAQSGSQAQVSEYNSGLAALEVYLQTAASVVNSVSNVFNIDVNKLVAGLGGNKNPVGFG